MRANIGMSRTAVGSPKTQRQKWKQAGMQSEHARERNSCRTDRMHLLGAEPGSLDVPGHPGDLAVVGQSRLVFGVIAGEKKNGVN